MRRNKTKSVGRLYVAVSSILLAGSASAFDGWQGTRLNDNNEPENCDVVKDASGAIVVYGTEGCWSDNHTKEQMFDGNDNGESNFFDPPGDAASLGGCWAGIGFERPKVVTHVRFVVRKNYRHRMFGCLIQGANTADFSDAVTLHVIPQLDFDNGWDEQWLSYPETVDYRAYRYFRLYGPTPYTGHDDAGVMCGNCTELEFWGFDADALPSAGDGATLPEMPEMRAQSRINGYLNLSVWSPQEGAFFELQRRAGEGDYATVATFASRANGWLFYRIQDLAAGAVDYRVRAHNPRGAGSWLQWTDTPPTPIPGAYIGTSSCWGDEGNYGTNAFDGNLRTFADVAAQDVEADNVWFGRDFGEVREVTTIRYARRPNIGGVGTMVGGCFQVAADADFTEDVQTIYTVANQPDEYEIVRVELPTPVSTRYIRYKAVAGGYGNVSELEFSASLTDIPSGLRVRCYADRASLVWDAAGDLNPRITGVGIFRRRFGAPAWTLRGTVPTTTTNFDDAGLVHEYVYQYALAYMDESEDGTLCRPVAAGATLRQLERDPSNLATLRTGVSVVWRGYPYKTDNTADMALKSFDGDLNTCCDLSRNTSWDSGGDVALGVDYGEGAGFVCTSVRACARDDGNWARLNGTVIYGSNSASGNWYEDAEPISTPFAVSGQNQWCEALGLSTNVYRYMFIRHPKVDYNFWGNVAELEFYGYEPTRPGSVVIVR